MRVFGFALPLVAVLSIANNAWSFEGQRARWADAMPAVDAVRRSGHGMTYVPTLQRTMILSGNVFDPQPNDELAWLYDGTTWARLPSNPFLDRDNVAIAFDSRSGEVVHCGAVHFDFDCGECAAGDTFLFDGTEWRLGNSAPRPARFLNAIVDQSAHQRLISFGGYADGPYVGDTWIYDAGGWSKLTVTSTPAARAGHAMAYDTDRDRVVLFGGFDGNATRNDTWELDGDQWIPVVSTGATPPARTRHAMAYDASRKRVVLFGGCASTPTMFCGGGLFDDTWEWDGAAWVDISSTSGAPPARFAHGMAYDADRERVVLFGGRVASGQDVDDTWQLEPIAGVAATLVIESGDDQQGVAGATLPLQLVVRATDTASVPIDGAMIFWTGDAASMSSVEESVTLTDRNGLARVRARFGGRAGAQTWTASIDGAPPVMFSGTASAAAASELAFDLALEAEIGEALDVAVTAYDRFRNVAIGYGGTIEFSALSDPGFMGPGRPSFVGQNGSVSLPRAIVFSRAGEHAVTVVDVGQTTLSTTRSVRVHPMNVAPVLELSATSVTIDTGEEASIELHAIDANDDLIEISVEPMFASVSLGADRGGNGSLQRTLFFAPGRADAGKIEVRVIASDGVLSVEQTVTLIARGSYYSCSASSERLRGSSSLWIFACLLLAARLFRRA